jgi:hypothetical protein
MGLAQEHARAAAEHAAAALRLSGACAHTSAHRKTGAVLPRRGGCRAIQRETQHMQQQAQTAPRVGGASLQWPLTALLVRIRTQQAGCCRSLGDAAAASSYLDAASCDCEAVGGTAWRCLFPLESASIAYQTSLLLDRSAEGAGLPGGRMRIWGTRMPPGPSEKHLPPSRQINGKKGRSGAALGKPCGGANVLRAEGGRHEASLLQLLVLLLGAYSSCRDVPGLSRCAQCHADVNAGSSTSATWYLSKRQIPLLSWSPPHALLALPQHGTFPHTHGWHAGKWHRTWLACVATWACQTRRPSSCTPLWGLLCERRAWPSQAPSWQRCKRRANRGRRPPVQMLRSTGSC